MYILGPQAISVLTILTKNRTSTKTPIDIGNGKIKDIASPIPI